MPISTDKYPEKMQIERMPESRPETRRGKQKIDETEIEIEKSK